MRSGEARDTLTLNARVLEALPNSLFKEQGTSLVIHAGADDNMTDPAGNSGDRIACGTIATPG